jgi:hypothetical protein
MTETCTACGATASGRFCNQCGAAIAATCRQCGAALEKGSRFCGECGTPVPGGSAPPETAAAGGSPVAALLREPRLPWVVAGLIGLALIAALVIPRAREAGGAGAETAQTPSAAPQQAPLAGGAGAGGTGTPPDLSQMTPREAADRLFNRVMTAVSQGDTAQAARFLPMAIAAYQQVPELNADGRYHLATLHLVNGGYLAAGGQAQALLAANPNHLFGLFIAARAADGVGDREGAAELYRRFLTAYDTEFAKPLPEYREHAQGLPGMRDEARQRSGS